MKQIIQNLGSGQTELIDLPAPRPGAGQVLIRTECSLVSLGTEKMLVDFGKAGWIAKARSQPDKVVQVLDKIKTDGLRPTVETVFRKLGEPIPLGYCNAGTVVGLGQGVTEFQIGDRVVSNGSHAELVAVPQHLVAAIPPAVSFEEASFTVIAAIALQGIRLISPSFGESVIVTGLGLIGLLAAQLLKANGCRVIGLDFDQAKVDLAKSWGIQAVNVANADAVETVLAATDHVGADAVLITASSKSNDVVAEAAHMSRKRGRIVLVGVIGLDLKRADFYEKELSFQVSCSYGPGRYESAYEQKGLDYPIAFVRWTENRNFQAVLAALSAGQLEVKPLITERVPLASFGDIYGEIGKGGSIASLITYPGTASATQARVVVTVRRYAPGTGAMAILGAGNFTKATILPSLKKAGAPIKYIASAKGLSGTLAAKKFDIGESVTDYRLMLRDPDVDAVVITTQHSAHAAQAIEVLEAGKHVFVEKPLALTHMDLDAVIAAHEGSKKSVTVGFNRRFSPFAQELHKQLGEDPGPINVVATMNAGFIPADSWVHDPQSGGGRIIGEACHLIDLITFFSGSLVEAVAMNALGVHPGEMTDNASILLRYANGSQGVVNYFANGSKKYAKERIELYSQNRTAVIDNFRSITYFGFKAKGFKKSQDKGHGEQFRRFYESIKTGGSPIVPAEEVFNASRAAIAAIDSLKSGQWAPVAGAPLR